MAQQLIVEGNDAIALAELCRKRGLSPPLGYASEAKFSQEFVKSGQGLNGALEILREALDRNDLNNIGIIVDANDQGPTARWQSIANILSAKYQPSSLLSSQRPSGSHIVREDNMPTIGVWIMPNNHDNGYLEHFLSSLIEVSDPIWLHAQSTVTHLISQPFNVLTPAKQQKALLHTWLSWQKDPGKPFGLAMKSGYFNVNAQTVEPLLEWFRETFEF